jgi:hypothetical protein
MVDILSVSVLIMGIYWVLIVKEQSANKKMLAAMRISFPHPGDREDSNPKTHFKDYSS